MTQHIMMELSTGHLTASTRNWLDSKEHNVICFNKDGYGWFVPVLEEEDPSSPADPPYPQDWMAVISLARSLNMDWIMLDSDGKTDKRLPYYDE